MADKALENAIARAVHLREKMAEFTKQLIQAHERRNAATEELHRVTKFIETWHEMAGTQAHGPEEQKVADAPKDEPPMPRPQNPNRRDVTLKCVEYIREAQRPLSRSTLFAKLEDDGINIYGKNAEMVLSTMLWRTNDLIQRLPNGGYWPVGDRLPKDHGGEPFKLLPG
jgi:hypothetical protein